MQLTSKTKQVEVACRPVHLLCFLVTHLIFIVTAKLRARQDTTKTRKLQRTCAALAVTFLAPPTIRIISCTMVQTQPALMYAHPDLLLMNILVRAYKRVQLAILTIVATVL
jgi:hypothetical protein